MVYSDNPSSPTSHPFEMEGGGDIERDGVIRGGGSSNSSRLRFHLCHSRNVALLFLFVLAFFMAGTDVFESRDMSLPSGDDDLEEIAQPAIKNEGVPNNDLVIDESSIQDNNDDADADDGTVEGGNNDFNPDVDGDDLTMNDDKDENDDSMDESSADEPDGESTNDEDDGDDAGDGDGDDGID